MEREKLCFKRRKKQHKRLNQYCAETIHFILKVRDNEYQN